MTYRYSNFLTELAHGRFHGVFVDDTGSPGLTTATGLSGPNRKSCVAVIVPADQIGLVSDQLPAVVTELTRLTGASEFHFTDIYGGRGVFKGLDLSMRLGCFRFMAEIFTRYKFPIIVQSFDPIELRNFHNRANLAVKRAGYFNLQKQDDLALLILLMRVKWFLQKNNPTERRARVFIDEGFKKSGAMLKLPTFDDQFVDGLVCFARSDKVLPIQLADFAAFALNRTQLLMLKTELSHLDRELLAILSPMAWNYQNIPKIRWPLDSAREIKH